MSRTQKITLSTFLPLTLLILLLDRLYPGADLVNYVKYATMLSLFFWAARQKKKYPEQKTLNRALFFVIVADFFFVYCDTIPALKDRVVPLGVASFTIAYLYLIRACQKNFRCRWAEALAAAFILSIYLPFYLFLFPYVQGWKFYGLSLFGLVLTYMSWTALCTLFRGYYSLRAALCLALAGIFILLSDLGVGLAITHPDYYGVFVPWLVNWIWAFYVPAWTLIVLVIAEEQLYRQA